LKHLRDDNRPLQLILTVMGIRHVVVVKWSEGVTPDQVEAIQAELQKLPSLISNILAYNVGADLNAVAGNADFGITADFATISDFQVYASHPEHLRVVAMMKPLIAQRSAVQVKLSAPGGHASS